MVAVRSTLLPLAGFVMVKSTVAVLLAVLAGTPLLFYMYVAPPFSHACATFAVTVCLWTWLRVRKTWSLGGVVCLGLTVGLMATMRDQAGLFAIGPTLDFGRWALAPRGAASSKERRDWLRTLKLIIAGTAAAIVAYNAWHKNNPLSPVLMGLCRVLVYISAATAIVAVPDANLLLH